QPQPPFLPLRQPLHPFLLLHPHPHPPDGPVPQSNLEPPASPRDESAQNPTEEPTDTPSANNPDDIARSGDRLDDPVFGRPSGIAARVSVSPRTDVPQNSAEQNATVVQSIQQFGGETYAGCSISDEAFAFLGQAVRLRVVVEVDDLGQRGIVNPGLIEIDRSSGSISYDALAECIVSQWEFIPASDRGSPRPQNVYVDVVLTPIGR
ncbi:MAG: hypothetical protein LRZ84_08510, partial [Desertifilum sp.]|nr:hypothetical protein [Desertifilum sp.]